MTEQYCCWWNVFLETVVFGVVSLVFLFNILGSFVALDRWEKETTVKRKHYYCVCINTTAPDVLR